MKPSRLYIAPPYIYIPLLLIVLSMSQAVHAVTGKEMSALPLDDLYNRLDAMVADREKFIDRREALIDIFRNKLKSSTSQSDRYAVLSQIYDAYSYFNSDSALYYADLAAAAAPEGISYRNEWQIKKADIYSATGLFPEAQAELDKIDRSSLSTDLLPNYFNALQYLYSHNAHFVGDDEALSKRLAAKADAYNDSIGRYITPGHPYAIWWDVVKADGKPVSDEIFNKLRRYVEQSTLDSRNDAIAAYWLAKAAEYRGDYVGRQRYMAMSAMSDINTANCDVASLEELANMFYRDGGIDRAYAYANYCAEMAQRYHNRIRIVSLSELKDQLHTAYLQTIRDQVNAIESQKKQITGYLIAACVLLLLSIISISFVIVLMMRGKRRKLELAEANENLKAKIAELDKAHDELDKAHKEEQQINASLAKVNAKLEEANNVKRQYIIFAFSMASDFINDADSIFKKFLRKIKTNQYGELRNELENPKFVTNEMKQFYKTFDHMFLSIYPDFIDELNATLPEKEKVVLKDGELPNTRLRIYALHKLGINESAKIAKMLRCSIQTVYNNRPKNHNSASQEQGQQNENNPEE